MAAYRWTPELFTCLSYAKGFKAGGFNLDRVGCPNDSSCPVSPNGLAITINAQTNTFFKPEYSDSIEAGIKNTRSPEREDHGCVHRAHVCAPVNSAALSPVVRIACGWTCLRTKRP